MNQSRAAVSFRYPMNHHLGMMILESPLGGMRTLAHSLNCTRLRHTSTLRTFPDEPERRALPAPVTEGAVLPWLGW